MVMSLVPGKMFQTCETKLKVLSNIFSNDNHNFEVRFCTRIDWVFFLCVFLNH